MMDDLVSVSRNIMRNSREITGTAAFFFVLPFWFKNNSSFEVIDSSIKDETRMNAIGHIRQLTVQSFQ